MANTTLAIETIVQRAQNGEMITPYQIAKIINSVLEANGVTINDELFQIRPQMMYNYDKNGLIVKGKKGVQRYTLNEVHEYVNKYLTNNKNLKDLGLSWSFEPPTNEYQEALDALNEDEA